MSLSNQEAEAALAPIIEKYTQSKANLNFDVVESFYHPDAVLVVKGKKALYGKKEITESFRKFAELTGKSIPTLNNQVFQGVKDYIIYTGEFSAETEKAGTAKGKFIQIWKKEGSDYLVYHDELEV